MSIHAAKPSDLPYIVSLADRHAEDLGFLTHEAMENYLARGKVTLARENGDPCGYFLVGATKTETRIFQACVQMDARGLGHAVGLLGNLIQRTALQGTRRITLHCRDGLEANGFWSACGFRQLYVNPGGLARKKCVLTWELDIAEALTSPALPYARSFLASLRAGT